jgi:hypothetical protein
MRDEGDANSDGLRKSGAIAPRIKILVAVHLVLGIMPAVLFLFPQENQFVIVKGVLISISFAQIMLLSFWAGMGTSSGINRFLGGLLGIAYITTWPIFGRSLLPDYSENSLTSYFFIFSAFCLVVFIIAGVFLLIRQRWVELLRVSDSDAPIAPTRFQYSIFHLLVITLVAAVVLGLAESIRITGAQRTAWQEVALYALIIIVFLVNTVCASLATLWTGQIGLRELLTIITAILLGIVALRHSHLDYVWANMALFLLIFFPTLITIASLVVVRSCGYRLMPKSTVRP